MTKRSVASLVMGTLHNPFGFMQPFQMNLKLCFRDISRLKLQWDEPVPKQIKEKVLEAVSCFFYMDKIKFHRKALFKEAVKTTFKVYWDGSKSAIGVCVIVKSVLKNGKVIKRLLQNKSKINSDGENTAPRSELTACLVSTRVYNIIKSKLKIFLDSYIAAGILLIFHSIYHIV